jgi:hypothetical protein
MSAPAGKRARGAAKAAAAAAAQQPELEPRILAMMRWFAQQGGRLHPDVEVRQDTECGGLGIFSRAALFGAGVELMSVPVAAMVTCEEAAASAIGQLVRDSAEWPEKDGSLDKCMLAALLVSEREGGEWRGRRLSSGRFRIYTLGMPRAYDDPLWWPDQDVALLGGTEVGATLAELKRLLRAERDKLAQATGLGDLLTWERWLWAHSTIFSRSFSGSLVGSAGIGTLAPVLDFTNHRYRTPIEWRGCGGGCGGGGGGGGGGGADTDARLTFLTCEGFAVAAGEQVYNNYGPKSNGDLLRGYGFVFEGNPHNRTTLVLPAAAAPMLAAYGLKQEHHLWDAEKPFSPSLLTALRLLGMSAEERAAHEPRLAQARHEAACSEAEGAAVSEAVADVAAAGGPANEARALGALREKLWARVRSLMRPERSVEEQVAAERSILADPSTGRNAKNALVYRLGERTVLMRALAHVDALYRQAPLCCAAPGTDPRARLLGSADALMHFEGSAPRQAGEVLASWALGELLAVESALDHSPAARALLQVEGLEDDAATVLALVAAEQSERPDSPWRSFFAAAEDGDAIALWSEAQLEPLRGSPLLELSAATRDELRGVYDDLFPALFSARDEGGRKLFAKAAFRWERVLRHNTLVAARTVLTDLVPSGAAVVPLPRPLLRAAGVAASAANAVWRADHIAGRLVLQAVRPVAPGDLLVLLDADQQPETAEEALLRCGACLIDFPPGPHESAPAHDRVDAAAQRRDHLARAYLASRTARPQASA